MYTEQIVNGIKYSNCPSLFFGSGPEFWFGGHSMVVMGLISAYLLKIRGRPHRRLASQ